MSSPDRAGGACVVGEVIGMSLLPNPAIRWNEDEVLTAAAALRDLGVDASGSLRLLTWSRLASRVTLGVAVGVTYGLDCRQLDAVLRSCGYRVRERRAVLGMPPE